MNTGELIQQFIKLRDCVEAKTRAFEESIKPYKDGMTAIENAVSQQIIELGGESIKTEFGTAYRTTLMAVKMADRETFMRFVGDDFEHRSAFLTAAVAKEQVKEYMEENKALPPGLDVAYIHRTNFRRS